jgi:uncharacterized protein (DUF488 family)
MSKGRLFSFGYEKHGQPDFITRLQKEKISLLLDVREVANSRRAGFSKNILANSLREAGIAYRHMKMLGTPKAGRDAAKRGDLKTLWPIVDQALSQPAAELALMEIVTLARSERVCLMCLEDDWRACHRARICERLEAEHGLKATHLKSDV